MPAQNPARPAAARVRCRWGYVAAGAIAGHSADMSQTGAELDIRSAWPRWDQWGGSATSWRGQGLARG
jgi:hypothetical protein